ncbi:integral membrane TerC family protein [Artemisia annua]|uniref:Integral membrane TerC family protein n=1 Tax=Artemisia annua TaxID=35608 RepID=A0A2U1NJY7_ARTAN|nr:integral membrane TerC family protein [Artemisia annua]
MHPPLQSDTASLKLTSISFSHQIPKWVHFKFTNSHNLSGVCRNRLQRKLPVVCSKGVKQEQEDQESVSSEGETSSSSYDENAKSKSRLTIKNDVEVKIKDLENYKTSAKTVALCVFSAVAFGVGIGLKEGIGKASEFFAGYLLEQSLSVDNLFVFVLIFKYFKVPLAYQNRVLSYGIAGAVIFRLSLILLGSATLQRFEAVNLLLASILLYSSFKLFFAGDDDEEDLSENFIVKTCQKIIPVTSAYDGNRFFTVVNGAWKATPLLLTVAVIELSDIAFAVDSIPAPSIGIVLGFIGGKMILDFFGYHVSTEVSLGCVATTLSAGVLLSLLKKSD